MKKVFTLAILAIIFASCHKDQLDPTTPTCTDVTSASGTAKRLIGSTYRVYYDNGGTDYGCKGTGGNCLDDVVVTPNISARFKNIIAVLHSDNPKAITNVLVNHKEFLEQYIDKDILMSAIDGSSSIQVKGTLQDGNVFLIFISAKGEIQAVYPIVIG